MNDVVTVDVEARSYELDPYGHLNNAVYVNWFEHGRSAYLRDRGLTWMTIPEDFGVRIVIVRAAIDYRAEVRLFDRLRIETAIASFGNSSFTFRQRLVFPEGRVAAEGEIVVVATKDGRAVPVPPALRARLA